MGWDTEPYNDKFWAPDKLYAVADVRFANGADNNFVNQLISQIDLKNFYGYSAWNTSANSLGSLIAGIKAKYQAEKYDEQAFKKLQLIRFLDDWAYQANVRSKIDSPRDISELMKPFADKLYNVFKNTNGYQIKYSFPWDRTFEVKINI